jgi:HSP20 family molecular chaperone IbpA
MTKKEAKDLDINITGDTLTIEGESKSEKEAKSYTTAPGLQVQTSARP